MNPTLRKWLIRPLVIATALAGLFAAVCFIILSTQQERIVNQVLEQVNRQMNGELVVEGSRISLFKNFPSVSIGLRNGRLYADKSKQGDPVLSFERLYVGFDLSEVLRQNYDVRVIFLQGGGLHLVRDKQGVVNLTRLAIQPAGSPEEAETDEAETDEAVKVHLQKMVLRRMHISFRDDSSGAVYQARVDRLVSSLRIDSVRMNVVVNGEMKFDVLEEQDTLFYDRHLGIGVGADYFFDDKRVHINTGHFKLQEAGFTVGGTVQLADTTNLNLRIKGDKQDFNMFRALLPRDLKASLAPFQYDGRLYFDALVNGHIAAGQLPHVQVAFGCEDAWFLNTDANKKVDQLGFKGYYTNGEENSLKTSELHILHVTARPEKGVFRGHFAMRNFEEPRALVQINSELELKFLGEFFGIQNLRQMTGTIKLDMDFREVHDINLPEESLNKLREGVQSRLTVEDLSFRIPGYPHEVRDVNIRAQMEDGRVTVDAATVRVGESDIRFSGSISDVRRFLRDRDKPVRLRLNAGSDQLLLNELLSYDTALSARWNEEIRDFHVNLAFETTAAELLRPDPLPRGRFEMTNLRGSFREYGHTFKQIGATVVVNDTLLRLSNFTGMIDSSDINFKGRIVNYQLWFDDVKKGKTEIAFDFKSSRFAFSDVFSREIRRHLPRGYRREHLADVWLRAKIDLRYDTTFRFMRARLANVTGELKQHKLKLDGISGGIKYGSKILSFDTLRGKIGKSDFDINLKYYFKGVDRYDNAIANSLEFKSAFLDFDEITAYDLSPKGRVVRDSAGRFVRFERDTVRRGEAFNIFAIPFSDFHARIDIGKARYHRLWLRDLHAKATMMKDQSLTIDTLNLKMVRGTIAMRGKFNGKNPDRIWFASRIRFDDVDLEKVMLKFDHFGQDVVINKNIKGRISGTIRSFVRVHPDLVPIAEESKAEMDLTIYNGSLVDFAPMQAMSSYFKDKNLRLIRFDTLSNKLTFTNGVLEIPSMDINSSLGYIQISGKQALDMNMEYYVRVPLRLVTKAGMSSLFRRKPEEVDLHQVDEIEYVDKDRKIAFMNLKVTGTPDNFEVGLGKEKRQGKS